MTRSSAPFVASRVARLLCPIPSRITLPPPKVTSSPYTVKSFCTSISNSVSARRTRSPVVGPYRSAYVRRGIFRLIQRSFPAHRADLTGRSLVHYVHILHALRREQPGCPLSIR